MNPSFIDICRQQPGVKTADSSLSDSTSSSNDREHTVYNLLAMLLVYCNNHKIRLCVLCTNRVSHNALVQDSNKTNSSIISVWITRTEITITKIYQNMALRNIKLTCRYMYIKWFSHGHKCNFCYLLPTTI